MHPNFGDPLFGDRIPAPRPRHAAVPRRDQKRSPGADTGCVFVSNPAGKFGSIFL